MNSPHTDLLAVPSARRVAYTAVDETEGVHRPMPQPHSVSLSDEELSGLVARIDVKTAAVQWACRTLPLPPVPSSGLSDWAFFVEAAPGMWVNFDDLPSELADALMETNQAALLMRPIQRPFSSEELAEITEEVRQMDTAGATVDWDYAEFCDPYGVGGVPHLQVGREYFVRAPSGRWLWFGDLPAGTREALRETHGRKLAFPAGLFVKQS
jgi:hypothetical protein